ncbi:MAG: hypothetical protein ABL888_23490 [Pirellulaceae bacterium]
MIPTLTALKKFDDAHKRGDVTLDRIGLILYQPFQRAWCNDTPKNGHIFAGTGGDSVHFCILEVSGQITDDSPVVMVVPCNPDISRLIVGDTMRDFLALGSVIGFPVLDQLVYDFDKTLGYLFDYDAYVRYDYFGAEPPKEDLEDIAVRKRFLRMFSKTFGLSPWPNPRAKFEALQKKWSAKIELPAPASAVT